MQNFTERTQDAKFYWTHLRCKNSSDILVYQLEAINHVTQLFQKSVKTDYVININQI